MLRHLPNAITLSRGLCGPVCMALLLGWEANFVAFWVFLFAICTDMIDGWVARKLNATSRAALFLDPLADKLLAGFTWAALWGIGFAPGWLAGAMVLRDLLIGVAWAWAAPRGGHWEPHPAGQIAVSFEGIALCVLLFHGPWLDVHWPTVGTVLGTIALALSLLAVVEYVGTGPRRPEP